MNDAQDPSIWFGTRVEPGEYASLDMPASESYSGADITIPVHVWRAPKPGPTVCITAAVHGDEINGTGAIRRIIREHPFKLVKGTLILVPVVNILAFERHARYLPDRRDLNRSFPGSKSGSLASRIADSFFRQITLRCDYGIDLHTAAVRRTNFPNVRADMSIDKLAAFARAFGAEFIVDSKGPKGSLRSSAVKAGCLTLIMEAGEVWKVQPGVVEYAVRGISNCLKHLAMIEGKPAKPPYRVETDRTSWVRATHGGFLEFHVAPGTIVDEGEPLATNADLTGEDRNVIRAPQAGVVIGMTTMPSVAPGDPVCHLAYAKSGNFTKIERAIDQLEDDSLHERVREDLSRSVHLVGYDDLAATNH
jgi:hypothetical protein